MGTRVGGFIESGVGGSRSLGGWRGIAEALLLPLLFVLLGVGAALLAPGVAPARSPYPVEMVPPQTPPQRWLVDGFNVVAVGLLRDRGRQRDGWWRREHREALLARARSFGEPGVEVWVVFDGPDPSGDRREGPTRTVYAASADAWLLAQVRDAPYPERLTVVTADARLANRVRARGARVASPGDFLRRCTG